MSDKRVTIRENDYIYQLTLAQIEILKAFSVWEDPEITANKLKLAKKYTREQLYCIARELYLTGDDRLKLMVAKAKNLGFLES